LLALLAVWVRPEAAAASIHRAVPPRDGLAALQTTAPTGRIVVKFTRDSGLRGRQLAAGGATAAPPRLARMLARRAPEARWDRRFRMGTSRLEGLLERAVRRSGRPDLPDLEQYAVIEGLGDRSPSELRALLGELAGDPAVETAFLEPVAEPAALPAASLASSTPDYVAQQGYLEPPPLGIGALAMTGIPGARGQSVRVIDIEGAWHLSHEDLPATFVDIGAQYTSQEWEDHGTAVLGVIGGRDNGLGVRGIAPDCSLGTASVRDFPLAEAIAAAADTLALGDVILIELHAPGPNYNGVGQFGYVPMEYWQDNFDAILLATAAGVIVCEAAGNGQQDLDGPVYRGLFDRQVRDSGAIMCGASAGSGLNPAWFTNYGSRVDLHGWGSSVASCGYGDLQGPPDHPEDEWYTGVFSGTSSASPIVVGAVVALAGMVEAAHGYPLDAGLARQILVQTGTPQEGTKHIGPRPDLTAAWSLAQGGIGELTGIITDGPSGQPISGATVRILDTGALDYTLADGGYRFTLLSGSHDLVASDYFHQSESVPVVISSGVTTVRHVGLEPLPSATLGGRVHDVTGAVLAGVTVTPLQVPLPEAVSDQDGHFSIPGAPLGNTYALLFWGLPGYGAAYRTITAAGPPDTELPVFATLPPLWEDFADDDGGYTTDGDVWRWGLPLAGGPDHGFSDALCWGVGMASDYPDDVTSTLTSPPHDFSDAELLYLSFHYWSETEAGCDGAQLRVGVGGDFEVVEPLSGYSDPRVFGLGGTAGWSGSTGGWRAAVFDLTPYIGSAVVFQLVFGADAAVNGEGFWFDDVAFATEEEVSAVPRDDLVPGAAPVLTAFPNPFNPSTTIRWRNPAGGPLRIAIHDVRGRLVRLLLNERAAPTSGALTWRGLDQAGRQVASGVYFVRLTVASGRTAVRRITLVE
jgi:hypothetical protein